MRPKRPRPPAVGGDERHRQPQCPEVPSPGLRRAKILPLAIGTPRSLPQVINLDELDDGDTDVDFRVPTRYSARMPRIIRTAPSTSDTTRTISRMWSFVQASILPTADRAAAGSTMQIASARIGTANQTAL